MDWVCFTATGIHIGPLQLNVGEQMKPPRNKLITEFRTPNHK